MKLLLPFDHDAKVTRILDSDYYQIQIMEPDNKGLPQVSRSQWIDRSKTDKKTGRKYISLKPPTIAEFLKRQYGAWKWRVYTEDPGAWFINISYFKQKHATTITTDTTAA